MNNQTIEQRVKLLSELDYMLFLTRDGGNEKIFLFLLLMREREIVLVDISEKYIERGCPKVFFDLLNRLSLFYQTRINDLGDMRIVIARSESDLEKFMKGLNDRADQVFGYPVTALESFNRNRDGFMQAEKSFFEERELEKYLYVEILSPKEHEEVLKKDFSEYKYYWFLRSITMSRDPVSREQELAHYRRWHGMMKEYKII